MSFSISGVSSIAPLTDIASPDSTSVPVKPTATQQMHQMVTSGQPVAEIAATLGLPESEVLTTLGLTASLTASASTALSALSIHA